MASRQLLVRERVDGSDDLEIVPMVNSLDVIPESHDNLIPEIGTVDLIQLANALDKRGYRITHLDVRDKSFQAFSPDWTALLEEDLIGRLRSGGASAALQYLQTDGKYVSVIGIEFRTPNSDSVRLTRRGALLETSVADYDSLFDVINESWHEVH